MKKFFTLLFIGGSVFAQENNTKESQSCQKTTETINSLEYCVYTCPESDSLNVDKKLSIYPNWFTGMHKELELIKSTDTLLDKFAYLNKGGDYVLSAIYKDNQLWEGINYEVNSENQKEDTFVVYKNGLPDYRYIFSADYTNFTYLNALADNDREIIDAYYDLAGESYLPVKELYSDGRWINWHNEIKENIVKLDNNIFLLQVDEGKNRIIITVDLEDRVEYFLLDKKGGIMNLYNLISFTDDQQEQVVNRASITNIGFEQKRITTKTSKGTGIWDAYFEDFKLNKWTEPNQYLYDYKRLSDRRDIHARVVVDNKVDKESLFFKILLSIAHNPELFRIDIDLNDFEYNQLVTSQLMPLSAGKKERFRME